MNPYPAYGQQGYAYPPIVPPPNQFYAPPHAQQYNGYPAVQHNPYRRPPDPGHHMYEPVQQRRPRKNRRASDEDVPRISEPARPRNNSIRTGLAPDYIFVSLKSHDTLKIANMTSGGLLESLRDQLLPSWPQGVASQSDLVNNEWTVKFLGGDVWSAVGRHGIMSRRLVRRLFILLAEEGFGYLATVDIGHPIKSPRLVFTSVPPDPDPRYFMISFSVNRRTLTIIDAPEKLAMLLGAALRAVEPSPSSRSMDTSRWLTNGVYEVVTSYPGTGRQDLATLMGGALKMIAAEGYRFEASIPFGKAGLFGLRGRREVWMFRKILAPRASGRKRRE